MLFNSYTFIFAFLPVTLAGYLILAAKAPRRVAIAWLVLCSLFFYGWWQPRNLWLLIFLLVFNYGLGVALGRIASRGSAKVILIIGLTVNLGLLCYYKYANFFAAALNGVTGTHLRFATVALPLGISFFVFQKIAYLVDAYRKQVRGYSLLDYSLFVTFFPQLIAGPIVHHTDVVPQFSRHQSWRLNAADLSVGLTQFSCGLFKKVVFADGIATYATPIFEAARSGVVPSFADGWIGALAYTFQLYFDFSAYSDMALGLGRLFGIKLPQNFNSPYKAENISDFWRRWHMTLSRFLRDYLYIPLGGNRKGPTRRCVNVMVTMLLGGLWHGAGWTFVFWGGLHGLYLMIHQAWQAMQGRFGWSKNPPGISGRMAGRSITFLAVVIAWVFFRAANFATACRLLRSMSGLHGFDFTSSFPLASTVSVLIGLWLVVWWLPNTQQLLGQFEPALNYKAVDDTSARPGWKRLLVWQPNPAWAFIIALVALYALTQTSRVSEFIYWQF